MELKRPHEPHRRTWFRSLGNRHRSLPHRRGGHQISLWSHSLEEARQITGAGENILFLPGFPLPAGIQVTADDAGVADAEIVVSVIPSEFLRPTLARLRPYMHPGQIVVSATKGVENRTFLRMTQVIAACLEGRKFRASSQTISAAQTLTLTWKSLWSRMPPRSALRESRPRLAL